MVLGQTYYKKTCMYKQYQWAIMKITHVQIIHDKHLQNQDQHLQKNHLHLHFSVSDWKDRINFQLF